MIFGGSMTALPATTLTSMRAAGLNTFIDVAKLSLRDFRRVKGIGPASASAVRSEMEARGLTFADEANSAYLDHFTSVLSDHLTKQADGAVRTYFRDLLTDELGRMRRAKLDMRHIAFDDSAENTVVILYRGSEHSRITIKVQAAVRRKKRPL